MITVDEIYRRLHVLVLHQIADITNCKKVPLIVYWKSLYNLSQGLLVKQSIRNIIAWRNGGVQLMNSWFYSVLVYGSRYVQRYHLQTNIATRKQTRIRRWNQPLFMSYFHFLPPTIIFSKAINGASKASDATKDVINVITVCPRNR